MTFGENGVCRYDGGTEWTTLAPIPIVLGTRTELITEDKQGNIWIVSSPLTVSRLDGWYYDIDGNRWRGIAVPVPFNNEFQEIT